MRHRVIDPRPVLIVRVAPDAWSWAIGPLGAAVDTLRKRGVRVIVEVRELRPGEVALADFKAVPDDPSDPRVARALEDWSLALEAIAMFMDAIGHGTESPPDSRPNRFN